MMRLQTLLRATGASWLGVAAVAALIGHPVAAAVFAVLGIDALALSAAGPDRRRGLVRAFAVTQEAAVAGVLLAALGDGLGGLDVVVAVLLVETVAVSALLLRAAGRTPALAAAPAARL